MLKRILAFVVVGSLICGGLPAYVSARTVQSTVDKLNVRTGPSLTSSVSTTLPLGASYSVEQQNGEWLQIRLSSNQTGWVAGWLVKDTAPVATKPTSKAGTGTSTNTKKPPAVSAQTVKISATVNVFSTPDPTRAPIGQISAGDKVIVQGTSNGWSKITYDGATAWIQPGVPVQNGQAPTTVPDSKTTSPTPAPVLPEQLGTISVNASAVNLRSMPTTDSNLLTTMSQGTVLKLVSSQGDWYQVQTPDGQTGWVANWLVTKPERTVPQQKTVTVLSSDTNIRSGSNTTSNILGRVQTGEKLAVLAKSGEWYQIKMANGQIGYIAGWLVSSDDNTTSKPVVVRSDELVGKIIVVDPGHGGNDNGATGSSYATLEKTVNLQVALLLRNKLESAGATVIMTRSDDRALTLQQRVDVAVTNNADLFVSIHHNTHPNTQTNGTIVFYNKQSSSSQLASLVQKEVVQATSYANLQPRFGDYYVLRENPVTSILAEIGFLTNPAEELKLRSPNQQEAAAKGLYKGIVQYFASIRLSPAT